MKAQASTTTRFDVYSTHESGEVLEVSRTSRAVAENDAEIFNVIIKRPARVEEVQS